MLLRVRWFAIGALTSAGALAYVAGQVRRARERFTPQNLARESARSIAAVLDAAADRIAPTSHAD